VASARRIWLVLGVLTAGAAALRLPFLGLQSLWYDETFTLAVVRQDTLGELWDQVELTESTPPLYYALTWAWTELLGDTGDAALRAPAAIAGVLCVPAAFLAVRRLAGPAVALGVAALTAFSPVLVAFSLNARAYSLLVLLACLSLWAMGEALERRSGRWLALWALTAAACLWTHYYAVFVVAAEIAVLLWRPPRMRVALAAGAVAAACAPLVPLIGDQRDERASHIDRLDLGERVEQAVRQLIAAPNPPSRVLEGLATALVLGGLAAGVYLARRNRGAALLAGIAAFSVLTPLVLALLGVDDHFFMRNLLVAWGALAVPVGLGLTRLRAIPLAAALAVFAALAIWTHADWRHQNADWEGALNELGYLNPRTPVVIMPGLNQAVANVYLDYLVATGPVDALSVWVVVEPGRTDRPDLREQTGFPRAAPPGFEPVETRTHRGFRMIHYAPRLGPATFDPAELGLDQIGQRPVILYSKEPD
jgi:4-amino-4-deoxy-L-arabinose transferase-like glycosyltransferase